MDTLLRYPHSHEIELKLEIASGHADALLAHPVFAEARSLPEQSGSLHATYYDTPDHILRQAGLTLRIRRKNARFVQTIKAESGLRGLVLNRGEWEWPAENGVDFAVATGTPLAPMIADDEVRKRIAPVFTIETDRRAFLIVRDKVEIEIALDHAKVSSGARHHSFCEVELELKKGDPSHLFAVACELAEVVPLRLSPFTKSDRGYELIEGMITRPITAETIELSRNTSCAETFTIITRSCLNQIVWNEALFRRTKDAEALHQLRVGFRRLQVATSLFKPMLSDRESRNVRSHLRWAANQLGPARDLDVLIGSVHKPADVGAYAAELKKAEKKRADAYDTLLVALSSPRFMHTILRAAAWIEAGKWLKRDQRDVRRMRERPILDYAPEELARRWKPIRKRLKRIAVLESGKQHTLRLRIKKLRYSSEFFEGLFGDPSKKPDRSWLMALKRLQDILGEMNDIVVASHILPKLARLDPERAKRRNKRLPLQAERSARTLRKSDPFWL